MSLIVMRYAGNTELSLLIYPVIGFLAIKSL